MQGLEELVAFQQRAPETNASSCHTIETDCVLCTTTLPCDVVAPVSYSTLVTLLSARFLRVSESKSSHLLAGQACEGKMGNSESDLSSSWHSCESESEVRVPMNLDDLPPEVRVCS